MIVKGATKFVKWGGKHLSKLKNVFNPDKIKAVTKGFNTLRNTAAHLSEKFSNTRIPTWQPAYATPNGSLIQPTTLGEAANDVKKQIVSMAGKVKDGVGRGSGKGNTLNLEDFTKEILEIKPMNSPIPKKWYDKGGIISINSDGTWTYTNKSGYL